VQIREFEIYDGDQPMEDDFYDEFEEDFEGYYEDDIDENADGAVE
jgi:hypothetical protein